MKEALFLGEKGHYIIRRFSAYAINKSSRKA
jgi:hypothetical protein